MSLERIYSEYERYIGKSMKQMEDEIIEYCTRLKRNGASARRSAEMREMGYKLLILNSVSGRLMRDRTLQALAMLLNVGAESHLPIVAPKEIHKGDKWVRAVIREAMILLMLRDGMLSEKELEDAKDAIAKGFAISDKRLAKEVGVPRVDIQRWRWDESGQPRRVYREAVEFMASLFIPGPGHPQYQKASGTTES